MFKRPHAVKYLSAENQISSTYFCCVTLEIGKTVESLAQLVSTQRTPACSSLSLGLCEEVLVALVFLQRIHGMWADDLVKIIL